MESKRILTATQLSHCLGGNPQRYRDLFRDGKIPGDQKSPRVILFDPEEVKSVIAQNGLRIKGLNHEAAEPEPEQDEAPDPETEAILTPLRQEIYRKAQKLHVELINNAANVAYEKGDLRRSAVLFMELASVIGQIQDELDQEEEKAKEAAHE